MRVSSLSDDRIIDLVSRYFVPVWVSRDNYQLQQPTKADRDLLARIDADRHRKRLEGGTVCVYIVKSDGEALATMTVQRACKPELLAPFLRKIIADRKLTARDPSARKASTASAASRPKQKESRVLLVCTRYEDKGPNRGTSRDRVELTKPEWSAFLPPAKAKKGSEWKVSKAVAEKLLRHAYPPLSHWDARLATVRSCSLSATVVSVSGDETLLRWEGKLDLIYPDKGKPDDGRLTARLIGYSRGDSTHGTLKALRLVSEEARYVWQWKGTPQVHPAVVAVELQP
jgi:hypothetical protein